MCVCGGGGLGKGEGVSIQHLIGHSYGVEGKEEKLHAPPHDHSDPGAPVKGISPPVGGVFRGGEGYYLPCFQPINATGGDGVL